MRSYVLVGEYQPASEYETRMTDRPELGSGSEVKGADREVHAMEDLPSLWSCLALWVALSPLVKWQCFWQFWSTWWLGILAAMMIVVMGVVSITLAAVVRENKSLTRKLHQMNVKLDCTVDSRTMELRKTNEELQISQKKAELASIAKSDFLAKMSHEIRTPIHGILGLTALLLESEVLSGDQEESLISVKECADLLLHIINSVLDLAKIEAGRLDIERVPFDIRKMVSSTSRMMEAKAQERGLKLLWEVDGGVPQSLVGDVGKLQQCLLNLVGNALKFTHEGSISVHIRLASDSLQASMMNSRDGASSRAGVAMADTVSLEKPAVAPTPESMLIHFEVRDTGIGINKEKLKDLFKPFTQADASTSRLYGGTGLGLCIVHRFVEILDGSIWVESEVEQGSAFHFCLPLSLNTSSICEEGSTQASPRMFSPGNVYNNQESHFDGKLAFNNIGPESNNEAIEQSYSGSQGEMSTNMSRTQSTSDLQEMCKGNTDGIVISIDDLSALELRDKDRNSLPFWNIKPYVHGPAQHFSVGDIVRKYKLQDSSERNCANSSEEMEKALLENKLQLKILLAEDNLVKQKIARRQLLKHGHVVTTVSDGQQALDLIYTQHDNFDLLLMDVQMPIMDGLFATEQIRKAETENGWSRVPILGLTAHAIQGYQDTCLDHGMDGYLGKPFDVEQLLKTISHLLVPREKLGQ